MNEPTDIKVYTSRHVILTQDNVTLEFFIDQAETRIFVAQGPYSIKLTLTNGEWLDLHHAIYKAE
jgi:hypothetical protein